MLSLMLWHIYLSLAACVLGVLWIYKTRKRQPPRYTSKDVLEIIQNAKLFPVGTAHKWSLFKVSKDHRVWETNLKPSSDSSSTGSHVIPTYGCYSKINCSSQAVLKVLIDVTTFSEWRTLPWTVTQLTISGDQVPVERQNDAPVQRDTISGKQHVPGSNSSRHTCLQALRRWLPKKYTVDRNYEIYRVWNKEDNGCCWLLELNSELQQWLFYLAQPVEKWFEKGQCLLTVSYSSGHPGFNAAKVPADILSGLRSHILYQKVQCPPLLNLSIINEDDSNGTTQEPESKEQPTNVSTASSKARLLFEDVLSKFSKPPEEGKSEPKLLTRFRNLIEEKKEWYEEKKRMAAIKQAESDTKAKEEVDSILDDSQILEDPSDAESEIICEDDDDEEPLIIASQLRRRPLVKAKTIDWVESVEPEFDAGVQEQEQEQPARGLQPVASVPSFGERIKRRLLEVQRRRSLDSSLTSSDEYKSPPLSGQLPNVNERAEVPPMDQNAVESDLMESGRDTCAELLSMKSKIANIDIKLPYDQQAAKSGGWIYCGLEREVVILRKVYEEGGPIQSYLGKGIIQCPPKTVFETLSNPRTRFTYDDMLKKMDILKEFDNTLKIVYWYHEVSQLFKRECRDFCILQHDQIEGSKYVISLRSMSWPGCPENDDVSRATLHASGWIIEPAPKQNQLHSMVTYITQMELGHSKTNSGYLVEELAAKQPLSIAFLRQYLTPTSNVPRPIGIGPISAPAGRSGRGESVVQHNASRTLASLSAQFQPGSSERREVLENPPITC